MAQQDFPATDLATALKDLQISLEKAEASYRQDEQLNQAIQETKDAAQRVEHRVKLTR